MSSASLVVRSSPFKGEVGMGMGYDLLKLAQPRSDIGTNAKSSGPV